MEWTDHFSFSGQGVFEHGQARRVRLKIPAAKTCLPSLEGRRGSDGRFTGHYWNGTKYTRLGANLEEAAIRRGWVNGDGDEPGELTETRVCLGGKDRHEVKLEKEEERGEDKDDQK